MAINKTKLNNILGEILGLNPVAVTFYGVTYSMTKTNLKKQRGYEVAGYADSYTFSLIGRVSDFSVLPEVEEEISVDGVTYRILGVEKDCFDVTFRLDLGALF